MSMQISSQLKPRNGDGRYGRREGNLASDLQGWLADLDAAEALRCEQLRQISDLRSVIYRHARGRGVSPTLLRATRRLLRK
jgi:hypothetical protein